MVKLVFKSEKERVGAYRSVFGSEQGKRVLQDLYDRYLGVNPIGPNEFATLLLVGQQSVIRVLLDTLKTNPMTLEETSEFSDWNPHEQ